MEAPRRLSTKKRKKEKEHSTEEERGVEVQTVPNVTDNTETENEKEQPNKKVRKKRSEHSEKEKKERKPKEHRQTTCGSCGRVMPGQKTFPCAQCGVPYHFACIWGALGISDPKKVPQDCVCAVCRMKQDTHSPQPDSPQLGTAVQQFQEAGFCVWTEGITGEGQVDCLHGHVEDYLQQCLYTILLQYPEFDHRYHGWSNFRPRDRGRFDVSVNIVDFIKENEGIFGNMAVSPPWYPIIRALLGEEFQCIATGAFISQPDNQSSSQNWHTDGPHLSNSTALPPHCVNVFIPLVDCDKNNGTEFQIGTHKLDGLQEDQQPSKVQQQEQPDTTNPTTTERSPHSPPSTSRRSNKVTPTVKRGQCLVFDYRVLHRGLANKTQTLRPVLYFTYAKLWYKDFNNFDKKRYPKALPLTPLPASREDRLAKRNSNKNNPPSPAPNRKPRTRKSKQDAQETKLPSQQPQPTEPLGDIQQNIVTQENLRPTPQEKLEPVHQENFGPTDHSGETSTDIHMQDCSTECTHEESSTKTTQPTETGISGNLPPTENPPVTGNETGMCTNPPPTVQMSTEEDKESRNNNTTDTSLITQPSVFLGMQGNCQLDKNELPEVAAHKTVRENCVVEDCVTQDYMQEKVESETQQQCGGEEESRTWVQECETRSTDEAAELVKPTVTPPSNSWNVSE